MNKVANCAAVLSVALALGCGDGGGMPRSGVASNKPLNEVDEDDLRKLCDWALGPLKVTPTQKEYCTRNAVDETESKTECEAEVQSCLARDDEFIDVDLRCPFSSSGLGTCDLSVSVLEDCYSTAIKSSRQNFSRASCSDPDAGTTIQKPASCELLEEQCPEVFGSDDTGSGPAPSGDEYQCASGESIPADFVCDGFDDCASGDDESCDGGDNGGGGSGAGTGGSAGDGGFVCNNGDDINDAFRCDTYEDCSSGEDELNCSGTVEPGKPVFKCDTKQSVAQDFVCDGTRDCDNGNDERTCDGGFVCQDGFDIPDQWKCDKRDDCSKGEDELGCPAP